MLERRLAIRVLERAPALVFVGGHGFNREQRQSDVAGALGGQQIASMGSCELRDRRQSELAEVLKFRDLVRIDELAQITADHGVPLLFASRSFRRDSHLVEAQQDFGSARAGHDAPICLLAGCDQAVEKVSAGAGKLLFEPRIDFVRIQHPQLRERRDSNRRKRAAALRSEARNQARRRSAAFCFAGGDQLACGPVRIQGASALFGRQCHQRCHEACVSGEVDRAVFDAGACREIPQVVVTPEVLRRAYGAGNKAATTVGADLGQAALGAFGAESAFKTADARLPRGGRQGCVAMFAGRTQFEHGFPPVWPAPRRDSDQNR